jgi:hypothetical protein
LASPVIQHLGTLLKLVNSPHHSIGDAATGTFHDRSEQPRRYTAPLNPMGSRDRRDRVQHSIFHILKLQHHLSQRDYQRHDATSYTPTKSLPQNRIIYWRVRAAGPNGPSLWSKSSFRSANSPSAPALASPSNKAWSPPFLLS